MEGNNNQNENSSQIVQQLLPPSEIHHSNSETNPQNNNSSAGGGVPSSNRRPRGRPPGSKNKPKPDGVIYQESPNLLKAQVLEISSGADIMETLNNYARHRGRGVCILNGNGTVSNVIIRQPNSLSMSEGVITLPGAFEIISITGTVLPPPAPPGLGGLSVLLSGGQGQVLGGNVVGPLTATSTVILTLNSFTNVVFERIPVEENVATDQGDASNGANQVQVQQVQPATSQTSTVPGSVGASLPLFNAGPSNYAISGNLFTLNGSNDAAPRQPF